MSILPPLNECLTGIYSEQPALRIDSAIFLWSHMILIENVAERARILTHILRRIDDPRFEVRMPLIFAFEEACLGAYRVEIGKMEFQKDRIARVLFRDMNSAEPYLSEVCYKLLGFLAKNHALHVFAMIKLGYTAVTQPDKRASIRAGWSPVD